MSGDCYVYILFREDGRPFYVGKGTGDRWLEHEAAAKKGRSHKDNIILAMKVRGVTVPKTKVAEGLTHAAALAFEIKVIAEIGREPRGPLVNLTAGGEGVFDPSPEVREKIASATRRALTGRKRPPEVVEKIAAAQRGKSRGPRPAAERTRRSDEMREGWARHGAHRPALTMKGRQHSPETKARMRAAALGRKMDDAARAKMRAAKLGTKAPEEVRAKMSASQRERWAKRKEA